MAVTRLKDDQITGEVQGPASSTDNAIVRFDSTTGKLVQNSPVLIEDDADITGVKDLTMSGTLSASQITGLFVDLAVTHGGTGASTASAARTNLGALGGSTGATDNAILRADGTGGATAQNSGVTISDTGDITTPINATLTVDNIVDRGGSGVNIESVFITNGAIDSADLSSSTNTFPSGHSVQFVYNSYSAANTGTTTIPIDNTIPQNTEGNEFMTLAITPKSASNILVIRCEAVVSHSAANAWHIGALFQDSTAGALAASAQREATATAATTLIVSHVMVAGTTSATTFKFRAGSNAAGTFSFNAGASTTPLLGTTSKSSITITEYKA